jgi:serine/threonine-protein kinase RsbW
MAAVVIEERLELDYPAEPRAAGEIRDQLEKFIAPYNLRPEDWEDVKMAISEACGNAICHGSPRGSKDRIQVRGEVKDNCLYLEICDAGPGFQPHEIALPDAEEWKPSGRGLFLMVALMDEVQFETTPAGTRVRLAKYLRPRSEEREGR